LDESVLETFFFFLGRCTTFGKIQEHFGKMFTKWNYIFNSNLVRNLKASISTAIYG